MKTFRTGAYESFYDMPLLIDWSMTKRCNYRCSYCFHYGYNRSPPPQLPFSTLSQLKAAVDNIASLNRPWYDVSFGGGEPTLHPHFFALIDMLHKTLGKRLNSIGIISNGSRNRELYEKIHDISKMLNVSLAISIHTDYVDMRHILEVVENLSRNLNIYFALMFNPAKREEVHLIYDILFEYRKRFPFELGVRLIYDQLDHLDKRYTPEDFEWQSRSQKEFEALADSLRWKFPQSSKSSSSCFHMFSDVELDGKRQIIDFDENVRASNVLKDFYKFKDMYCIAYSSLLRIEETGLCHGLVCVDPILCNIYQADSFRTVRERFIGALKCPFAFCSCGTNHCVPKFSDLHEAKKFMEVIRKKQKDLFFEYDTYHSSDRT